MSESLLMKKGLFHLIIWSDVKLSWPANPDVETKAKNPNAVINHDAVHLRRLCLGELLL
jgi:hypothetical protein